MDKKLNLEGSAKLHQWKWIKSIFSMEIRKMLSYRFDFWVQFIGTTLFQFLVAYFLWRAVYDQPGTGTGNGTGTEQIIAGFSFSGMMLYYVLAPMIHKIVSGQQFGIISQDIYTGELNRYLLYPLCLFQYKLTLHMAQALFFVLQIAFGLLLFRLFTPFPAEFQLTLPFILLSLLTTLLSAVLYFFMSLCLEMVAFWADQVWTLMVMLRFIIGILGGSMLPLDLYPLWAQKILSYLPFHYLVSFPLQIMQGKVSFFQWGEKTLGQGLWIIIFYFVANFIWKKGSKEYSGVGI